MGEERVPEHPLQAEQAVARGRIDQAMSKLVKAVNTTITSSGVMSDLDEGIILLTDQILSLSELHNLAYACAYSIGVSTSCSIPNVDHAVDVDFMDDLSHQPDAFRPRLQNVIRKLGIPRLFRGCYGEELVRERIQRAILEKVATSDSLRSSLYQGYKDSNEFLRTKIYHHE